MKLNKGMIMADKVAWVWLILICVACIVAMCWPAEAAPRTLELEAGAGVTLYPDSSADVGGVVALGYPISDRVPVIGGETLFATFGKFGGVDFLGPSISVRAVTSTRVRIGWAAWRDGHLGDTVFLWYGVPFTVSR